MPVDQFTVLQGNGHNRSPRWSQIALLVPAVVTAVLAWWMRPDIGQTVSGLLTATSIMTGFIFSMAVVFWNRSIDARRDPSWAIQGSILTELDQMRSHLIFTVGIGVFAATCLVLLALFEATACILIPMIGGLMIYLLCLVVIALVRFNSMAIRLRP